MCRSGGGGARQRSAVRASDAAPGGAASCDERLAETTVSRLPPQKRSVGAAGQDSRRGKPVQPAENASTAAARTSAVITPHRLRQPAGVATVHRRSTAEPKVGHGPTTDGARRPDGRLRRLRRRQAGGREGARRIGSEPAAAPDSHADAHRESEHAGSGRGVVGHRHGGSAMAVPPPSTDTARARCAGRSVRRAAAAAWVRLLPHSGHPEARSRFRQGLPRHQAITVKRRRRSAQREQPDRRVVAQRRRQWRRGRTREPNVSGRSWASAGVEGPADAVQRLRRAAR